MQLSWNVWAHLSIPAIASVLDLATDSPNQCFQSTFASAAFLFTQWMVSGDPENQISEQRSWECSSWPDVDTVRLTRQVCHPSWGPHHSQHFSLFCLCIPGRNSCGRSSPFQCSQFLVAGPFPHVQFALLKNCFVSWMKFSAFSSTFRLGNRSLQYRSVLCYLISCAIWCAYSKYYTHL